MERVNGRPKFAHELDESRERVPDRFLLDGIEAEGRVGQVLNLLSEGSRRFPVTRAGAAQEMGVSIDTFAINFHKAKKKLEDTDYRVCKIRINGDTSIQSQTLTTAGYYLEKVH